MEDLLEIQTETKKNEKPLCTVFGECGGCLYQDISYEEELSQKEESLKEYFKVGLNVAEDLFEAILSSPQPYHYRHRIDLSLIRRREEGIVIGFRKEDQKQVIPIESCSIAMKPISDFLPDLKKEAIAKLPEKYKMATLTVKTDDEGKVFWGGIGRKSLRMSEEDFFWTEIRGKRLYYSLDTFFQANLFILPKVIERLRTLPLWDKETLFFDLYSGVGLFGFYLADLVKQVMMIEESPRSFRLAQFNVSYHYLKNVQVWNSKVEDVLSTQLELNRKNKKVLMIDPPRQGLKPSVSQLLRDAQNVESLLYLSCHPDSLIRDLKVLLEGNWKIEKIMPLDFFPRTKHIETLVWLEKKENKNENC